MTVNLKIKVTLDLCEIEFTFLLFASSVFCFQNVSWVALGLCALFLLISIILCVRASKHFRRVSGRERIDDSGECYELRGEEASVGAMLYLKARY